MSKDLTEQWKNGELEEGAYYVKLESGKIDIYFMVYDDDDCDEIVEILAPIPSFEQWEKLNWYAGNGVEENQELKMENAHLKELLKDARNVLKMVDTYCGDYDSINGFLIVEKIDEALK